jgi:hypothetical protein
MRLAYSAIQMFAPGTDVGFDLGREYEIAKKAITGFTA